jgi:hypothetical protein
MDNPGLAAKRQPTGKKYVKPKTHATHSVRVQLKTTADIDQRTLAYRRAKKQLTSIASDLGGDLSTLQYELADHTAFLSAVITSAKVEWFDGKQIDLPTIAMLINAQRRCARDIGIKRIPKNVDDLREYLEQHSTVDNDEVEASP